LFTNIIYLQRWTVASRTVDEGPPENYSFN